MRQRWLVRVADSAQDAARKILESDLEQLAMILTTTVAAVTYGWIEGYAIESPRYDATQVLWILGHFSTYSVAMWILFACVTGGFGLLKARSMFVRGKRYFLFTFAGNFPFSWLVEDFAFFWFSPEWRLTNERWTNWFLGGIWILDPWRESVRIWIPNWYWPVLVFWLGMMWYAHRCTVYDNLVKDEISRQIEPRKIEIPSEARPREPPKTPEEMVGGRSPGAETPQPSMADQVRVEPGRSLSDIPRAPKPQRSLAERPTLESKMKRTRSIEAQEALNKLRARVLRNDA